MKKIYLSLFFTLMCVMAFAQTGTITGSVSTADSDAGTVGAVVRLAGTSYGMVSDLNGQFTLSDVPVGDYTLITSYVGYDSVEQPVTVTEGVNNVGIITLGESGLALQSVEIIADIAVDRKTPVAVSNISGQEIAEKTGNQELPMMLATAPSVYASQETGGYGDSRLTVRGFGDENVVVMVNGVPVNDMENNSLYWSNWTGLQDVASKVQIQRGLGASLLSVPSIGGTVNIISKATDMEKGGWAQYSLGNDMYRKFGMQLSTGNMNGWAMTFAGSRTTGDGYVDGNFIDAYSWFGSITRDWDNHSLMLTGFGAPQRHGQGFYRELNTFVEAPTGEDYESYLNSKKAHDFNRRVALRNVNGSANSIRYNDGWGYTDYDVNSGFNYRGVFNQYSNFYHKPQVSLTHFWDASDTFELTSNVYGSWGRGGGASNWNKYRSGLNYQDYQATNGNMVGGPINWDNLISDNIAANPSGIAGSTDADYYFFRASMNHHDYYGLMTKGIASLSDNVDLTVGLDARTYKADHVRKVIDMLGLEGFAHQDFAYNNTTTIAVPSTSTFGYTDNSLFNRDNTGKVNWLGGFSELEYSDDVVTAALGGSVSNKSYKKIQRITGRDGESEWYNYWGGTVKGGVNYNLSRAFNLYGNAGYLSIQPIFDNVFPGGNNGPVTENDVFTDAANEKVLAFELGSGLRFSQFAANLNLYRTSWQDKAVTVVGQDVNDENVYGNAFGVDALHQGIELDLRAQPTPSFDINGAVSLGDWTWQNNTEYTLYDQQGNLLNDGGLYIKDVKVGNAPQTQFNISGNYKTPFGLGLYAGYQHNMDYYANFDTEDRDDPSYAGINPNLLPEFGLTNAGVNYNFDLAPTLRLRADFNVNNLMDILYVNNAREGFAVNGGTTTYDPLQTLSGNFGLGRTWNASAKLFFKEAKPKVQKEVVEIPVATEPVVLDRDNDGVIDAADKCPDTPGTVNGCPDTDGDGVIDSEDECPEVAGTVNGCPEEAKVVEVSNDRDGDGVIDSKDNCPDVAGNVANYGCPGEPEVKTVVVEKPTVEVVERLNFIARSVLFNTGSATLRTESRVSLDEIASTMNQYPNTTFIVEGHTDNTGSAAFNKTLSQERANSVVNYLVEKGVSRSKLSAIGYGEERPIATNETAEGRQQNRRVVIKVGN